MSSATVNTEFIANYPNGFSRSNSVVIGVAGFNKQHGVWYGYMNNDTIRITLANSIVVQTTANAYVGQGAKIKVAIMKI